MTRKLPLRKNKTRYAKKKGMDFEPIVNANLKQYVDKQLPNKTPRYYFHMGNFNKTGIKVKGTPSYKTTPLAVYAYPLDKDYLEQLLRNSLPYADDFEYVTILEATEPDSMLYLGYGKASQQNVILYNMLKEANAHRLRRYLEKALIKLMGNSKHFDEQNAAELLDDEFQPKFNLINWARENATVSESEVEQIIAENNLDIYKSLAQFNRKFRDLSYTSIYDSGSGTIYPSEPHQIAFLTPKAYKVVAQLENPNSARISIKRLTSGATLVFRDYLKPLAVFNPKLVDKLTGQFTKVSKHSIYAPKWTDREESSVFKDLLEKLFLSLPKDKTEVVDDANKVLRFLSNRNIEVPIKCIIKFSPHVSLEWFKSLSSGDQREVLKAQADEGYTGQLYDIYTYLCGIYGVSTIADMSMSIYGYILPEIAAYYNRKGEKTRLNYLSRYPQSPSPT